MLRVRLSLRIWKFQTRWTAPEFRKAWSNWIAFHKSAGKPLNPVTAQFQIEHLARQGRIKRSRIWS
jgi:hypothetical protein